MKKGIKLLIIVGLASVFCVGCGKECSEKICTEKVYKEDLCELHYKLAANEAFIETQQKIDYYESLLDEYN